MDIILFIRLHLYPEFPYSQFKQHSLTLPIHVAVTFTHFSPRLFPFSVCNYFRIMHESLCIISLVLISCHKGKGKRVPLQAWSGAEGSRKLRLPNYVTTAQNGGKLVSLTHRPPLPPRKCSQYSFMLQAESAARPQCDRKYFMSMKNSNDFI